MAKSSFHLERFVDAQDPVFEAVKTELRQGRKQSHWMWFVFPQLKGLGHSAMAHEFGISGKQEAAAYLAHPILGPRLEETTQLVNQIEGRSALQIFSTPDNLKFWASMTLFSQTDPAREAFATALQKYFQGEPHQMTLDLLSPTI